MATTLFMNGEIVTLDSRKPRAEALAVRDGRIAAVGSQAEVRVVVGEVSDLVDLGGHTVLPGFIDAHVHMVWTGMAMQGVDLVDAPGIEAILDLVRTRATRTPQGEWICGNGYDEWVLAERRSPTRAELDAAAPDHPVLLRERGGHSCVVNSAALRKMALPLSTSTGLLQGDANQRALAAMGAELSVERRCEAIRLAARRAAEKGLTTIHALEGGTRDDEPELRCLMAGDLPVRVVPYPITEDVEWVKSLGLPRIGGCLLLDGAIEAHTAALFEPYADAPGELGKLYHTREELAQFVCAAHEAGLQIAVHAVGERAIQQFLDVLEPVLARSPRDHRHRIEHFILPTAEQIARVARLGVAVCAQPTFERLWGGEHGGFARRLGVARMRRTTPLGSLLDAGALVAGGSDSYVSPLDPLLGIHSAVNHPNPAQRLTVEEALRLFTLNAARIAFEDHLKGSLEVGKLADFVVLARNPLAMGPQEIQVAKVVMTYVGGRLVPAHAG